MTTTALPLDVATLMHNIGYAGKVEHNCHVVSAAIVHSGKIPGSRVARGAAIGVLGQHSWVVVGDPYDKEAPIIDATLWSYDDSVPGVWLGTGEDGIHRPHGDGHLFQGEQPTHHGGETIHLTPAVPLSQKARDFLRIIGAPFDLRGWGQVAHLPVRGWPSKEIIEALLDTPRLAVLVPIDITGMLTDRNPSGMYLPR